MLGSDPIISRGDMEPVTSSLKWLDMVTCSKIEQSINGIQGHRTLDLSDTHRYAVSAMSELRSHNSKRPHAAGLMFNSWGKGVVRTQQTVSCDKVGEEETWARS